MRVLTTAIDRSPIEAQARGCDGAFAKGWQRQPAVNGEAADAAGLAAGASRR